MRVVCINRPPVHHFTDSDAVYQVPLRLARKHDVTLISSEYLPQGAERRELAGRVRHEIVFALGPLWWARASYALARVHWKRRVDAVVTGVDEWSLVAGLIGSILGEIPWVCVCEDHPFQTRYSGAGLFRSLEKRVRTVFLRLALLHAERLVLFIHPGVLDFLKLPATRKVLLTNSTVLETIIPLRRTVDSDQELIAAVGAVSVAKGADYVLRCFGRVARDRPAARLVFVGEVVAKDKGRLADLASELGVSARVDYTGLLPWKEALTTAARATVCVHAYPPHPWLYWNQVLKVCEYLALGKAVVSVDHPGVRSLIQDGRSGLLVPWADESAMASAVTRLLENAVLRATLENGARERAEEISWERTGERLLSAVEECGRYRRRAKGGEGE